MIEYLYQEGVEPCSIEPLKVRVDGIETGEIRKVESGYAYFTKCGKYSGKVFKTINEVHFSLMNY